jgi:hypothetical protein
MDSQEILHVPTDNAISDLIAVDGVGSDFTAGRAPRSGSSHPGANVLLVSQTFNECRQIGALRVHGRASNAEALCRGA